jgi:three-Cys-motif partner protein
MAVPRGTTWPRDPHTEAKHRILEGYLQAYFPIMAKQFKDVGVGFVDAFAGPGEYDDGGEGSPIIALRTARRHEVVSCGTGFHFVFIEKAKKRSEHLAGMLKSESIPSTVSITHVTGACDEVLLPTLEDLGLCARPLFVNLDGWGVDTPYEVIARIGASKRPEVMITFNSQWLTRFAEKQDAEAGDRVFGDDAWREVVEQPTEKKKRWLVDLYRARLAECGFTHQLTFELDDEGGQPLFLVFGTSSEAGVEKMKDAMWRIDASSGSRFKDPRDPNQTVFDLSDRAPNLTVLGEQILEFLEAGERTMAEIQRFALLETIFKKAHAPLAVKQLGDKGKVTCKPARAYADYKVMLAPVTLF